MAEFRQSDDRFDSQGWPSEFFHGRPGGGGGIPGIITDLAIVGHLPADSSNPNQPTTPYFGSISFSGTAMAGSTVGVSFYYDDNSFISYVEVSADPVTGAFSGSYPLATWDAAQGGLIFAVAFAYNDQGFGPDSDPTSPVLVGVVVYVATITGQPAYPGDALLKSTINNSGSFIAPENVIFGTRYYRLINGNDRWVFLRGPGVAGITGGTLYNISDQSGGGPSSLALVNGGNTPFIVLDSHTLLIKYTATVGNDGGLSVQWYVEEALGGGHGVNSNLEAYAPDGWQLRLQYSDARGLVRVPIPFVGLPV